MGNNKALFLSAIESFITSEKLFGVNAKIIVAVSGGIDSIILTEVLLSLREKFNLGLAIAHVNYGLRGEESDNDESFVRDYAQNKGLHIHVKRADMDNSMLTDTGSFQERARAVRYAFLKDLLGAYGYDYAATGHNANDNAETVFLNFLRGSGPEGLKGIPPKRGFIIRPLLSVTRKEIESFAQAENLSYREDSSNLSDKYARNVVRNEIFPLIQSKLRKNVRDSINRSSGIIRSVDEYVQELAQEQINRIVHKARTDEYFIAKDDLHALHPVIADYVIRDVINRFFDTPVSYEITRRVKRLAEAPTGCSVILSSGYRADSESAGIRIYKRNEPEELAGSITLEKEYCFDDFTFKSMFVSPDEVSFDRDKNIEYIDADKIIKPLSLRYWKHGDRIRPLGMNSEKKVSDVFIDAKIPRAYKDRIPILVSPDGIIWICGIQLDDRFKVTKASKNILKLEYIPHATG